LGPGGRGRRGGRVEHRMVDDQLVPAVEEIGQRLAPVRSLEDILLLHCFPGEIAAPLAQAIAEARELFLFRQKLLAGREPLLVRRDLVPCHDRHVLSSLIALPLGAGDISTPRAWITSWFPSALLPQRMSLVVPAPHPIGGRSDRGSGVLRSGGPYRSPRCVPAPAGCRGRG